MNNEQNPARRLRHGQRPTEPVSFGDAGAGQQSAPADLQQLKALALAAAQSWANAEYTHARNLGQGGPGITEQCDKAEAAARAAIESLAARIERAAAPATASGDELPSYGRAGDLLSLAQVQALSESIKPGDGWGGEEWDFALANAAAAFVERKHRAAVSAATRPNDAVHQMRQKTTDTWTDCDPSTKDRFKCHPTASEEFEFRTLYTGPCAATKPTAEFNAEHMGHLINRLSVANRRNGWTVKAPEYGNADVERAKQAVDTAERNLLAYVQSLLATKPAAASEDRQKLRAAAVSAAYHYAACEYEDAANRGKGGPGIEAKVKRAEDNCLATINSFAAAPLLQNKAAPATTAEQNDIAEALEEAKEGIEILDTLIASVERHGNYSKESTLGFLGQLEQCLRPIRALKGADDVREGA